MLGVVVVVVVIAVSISGQGRTVGRSFMPYCRLYPTPTSPFIGERRRSPTSTTIVYVAI